jgi:sulfotransferase
LEKHLIKTDKLNVRQSESDSHYRYKYRHKQSPAITGKVQHEIPMRIQMHIQSAFRWYYEMLYPEFLNSSAPVQTPSTPVLTQKK